ncbi:MAG: ADOP family duplicated permease [Acidobacteriota bacterium]
MSSILQDVRYAARTLARSRGFAAAAIVTLAIGIGGTAAMFSLVERIVLRDLPFPKSSRLVRLHDAVLAAGGQVYRGNLMPDRWRAIEAEPGVFDRFTAQRVESLTWTGGETAAPLEGASVSPGTFEIFGISPILGRAFAPEEERLGGESGAVLVSESFWRQRLGGDPGVLGRSLPLADRTLTIVGVLPRDFHFPYHADVWLPLRVDPSNGRDLLTIGRLAPGVTIERARAAMAAVASRLAKENPAAGRDRDIDLVSLKEDLLRGEDRLPLALLSSVAFLLLLACANLAALLLSRSVARERELAIRGALGATRWRQLRQLLIESLLLAFGGGSLGLLLAASAESLLAALVPRVLGEELRFSLAGGGWRVALFSVAVSAAVGILFGIVPGWRSARADPADALRAGGRAGTLSLGGRRLLRSFVAGEVALATVLLAGSAFMVSDLVHRQNREVGLQPRGLLSVELPLPAAAGATGEGRDRVLSRILRAAREAPGVSRAAATTVNPFWGGTWGTGVAPEGAAANTLSTVNYRIVTPGLLEAWETPILSGRDVADFDRAGTPAVVVVSRRLARRFWGDQNAIGRRLVGSGARGSAEPMTVVGVAGDVRDASELEEAIYVPYAQAGGTADAGRVFLMLRGASRDESWATGAVRAIARSEPALAVAESAFMDRLYQRSLSQNRLGTSVLSSFALFGLLLASIGVFGAVAFLAGQRRLEIGIRLAVGAGPRQIRGLLLGEGARLAAIGCAAGLLLAYPAWLLLARALPDFSGSAWPAAAVAAALFTVAILASDAPARRAARADPSETLRS